ncbi:GerMN domain-containing protein [Paenibacillus sp. GCM10012307]|uniref:GerMN domain-containing protein n=1 Tax=Paenibacillus roseus TaxID=2798579 RepID=A0A934J783_9BACL|nr:GerMN domain-containing protein [Paenibacillus roseus]MBJ6362016.1 GerMN domain-containing protein [Paenibacillus roseus]
MMKRQRWMVKAVPAAIIAASLLITGGCGLFSKQASTEIDPPPAGLQENSKALEEGQALNQGEGNQLTVYLKDGNDYIAPVTLSVPLNGDKKPEQVALEVLVAEGPYANQLPEGFKPVISKGTVINKLDIITDQELAIVDWNEHFTDYNGPDERRIVEAVTWTLTGFPGIKQVQFWQEGEKLSEMPVDGFPLAQTLSRNVGINLERSEGIDLSRSTPVTLYFSSVTPADTQYYVPVTRLIDRSEDVATAALKELIAGPEATSPLNSVMTQDLEVGSIKIDKDIVTVDLQDQSYKDGQLMPSELIQSVILSLAENTGVSKVQVQLNGSDNVKDTDNRDYSQPVDRPVHVNAIKS